MKPLWLKTKLPTGQRYRELKNLFTELRLNTVCEEARCPNIADCWTRQTATVMILGEICTRSCGFCAVTTGKPLPLDANEPERVAEALSRLKLKHVVLTSVDRDDLPDGGAAHFASTIQKVRERCPQTQVEVLIPDFRAQPEALAQIFAAGPHILNHNLETVASLQKTVRPQASYKRSLKVLRAATDAGLISKSGLMLGLGESKAELKAALQDLREQAGVSILTLGQYLQPTRQHLPVQRYYTPQEFTEWKDYALSLGFPSVASGPLVRSSYHADEAAAALSPSS